MLVATLPQLPIFASSMVFWPLNFASSTVWLSQVKFDVTPVLYPPSIPKAMQCVEIASKPKKEKSLGLNHRKKLELEGRGPSRGSKQR
ncbi:hypothetical protein O181_029189 [Austropuccinia psidii MF-1]|uniref:Uncharacterized protein n=1 Tax=Austropuccinia psidii MF-1 TaxID=1389203 RepID=A0A9Q3H4B7_9BASI|nr:hypothetical protein [Austropuccinia psidii MF-1]